MKNRKLVALICALAMVLGMFAACGPATESPVASATPDATATPVVTPTPTVVPTEPPLVQDDYFKFNFFPYDYGKNEEAKTTWLATVELKEGVDVAEAAKFTELTVPAEYEGWTVDGLGEGNGQHFFYLLPEEIKITKIIIPSTVTYFEFNAFNGYEPLAEVEFEDVTKITAIGGRAFHGTTYAKNALEAEGQLVINNILCLTAQTGDVVIPEGIVAIPDGMFGMNSREDIEGITSITLPASATTLHGVTDDIRDLAKGGTMTEDEYLARITVKVPYGSTAHTVWAPERARTCQIEVINAPYDFDMEAVPDYGKNEETKTSWIGKVIINDPTVTEIVIPETYNGWKIDGIDTAFLSAIPEGCTITKVTVPASVTYIEFNAFNGYEPLADIEFKDETKITGIGGRAFHGTTYAAKVLANKGELIINNIWCLTSQTGDVVVPDGVVGIPDAPFGMQSSDRIAGITSIKIPDSVTWINGLTDDIRDLGTNDEEKKEYLGKVTVIFKEYTAAHLNWYPNRGLDCKVEILPAVPYTFEFFPYNYGKNEEKGTWWLNNVVLKDGVDPADVTEIVVPAEYEGWIVDGIGEGDGKGFFNKLPAECQIKKITLPSTITYIEFNTFKGYTALEEVVFEDVTKLTAIGGRAFTGTTYAANALAASGALIINNIYCLTNQTGDVVIPEGVVAIPDGIFGMNSREDIEGITSITLPASATTINGVTDDIRDLGANGDEQAAYLGKVTAKVPYGSYAHGFWYYDRGSALKLEILNDPGYDWELVWSNNDNKTSNVGKAIAKEGVDADSITELIIPEYWGGYKIASSAGSIVGALKNVKKITLNKHFGGFFLDALANNTSVEEIVVINSDKYIHNAPGALETSKWFKDQAAANNGFVILGKTVVGIAKGGDVVIPEGVEFVTDAAFRGFDDLASVKSLTLPSTMGTEFKNILDGLSDDTKKNMTIYYYPGTNSAQWVENWKDLGYTAEIAGQAKYTFEIFDWYGTNLEAGEVWLGNIVINEGYDASEIKEIIIPETFNGYKVIGLGNWDNFTGKPNEKGFLGSVDTCAVETVVIPDTITDIDFAVFWGYNSIKNFVFENAENIKSVGWKAFLGTQWCTDQLAATGNLIVGNMLLQTTQEGDVVIPEGVEWITDNIFSSCANPSNITSVTIPASANGNYMGRNILESIPEDVAKNVVIKVYWGSYAHQVWAPDRLAGDRAGSFKLEVIDDPGYTWNAGWGSLKNPSQLILNEGVDGSTITEVRFPEYWDGGLVENIVSYYSLKNIDASKVTKVIIPATIKGIYGNDGENAIFYGLTNLATIEFVGDVVNFNHAAPGSFYNTGWVNNDEDGFVIVGTTLFAITEKAGANVVIPEGVTKISDGALANYKDASKLNSIALPATLTGDNDFWQKCDNNKLKNVTLMYYPGTAAAAYANKTNHPFKAVEEFEEKEPESLITVNGTTVAPNMNKVDYTWGTPIRVDNNTFNAGLHNYNGTCENIYMDLYVKHDAKYVYIGMVSPDADLRGTTETWKGDGVQFKIGTEKQLNIHFALNEATNGFNKSCDYEQNMWVENGNLNAIIAVPLADIDVVDGRIEFTFLRISGNSGSDYAGWLTYGNFFAEGATATPTATDPNFLVLTNEGAADLIATGTTVTPNFNAIDATWGAPIRVDGNTYNAGLHNHDGTCEDIYMDLYVKHDAKNVYIAMVSPDADVRGSSESWKGDGVQFKIGTASQKNIYFTVNDDKVGFSGADDYTRNMWVDDGKIYAAIAVPFDAIDVVDGKIQFTFLRISATSGCDYDGWLTYGNFFADGSSATATATEPCYIVLSDAGMTDLVAGKVDAAPNMDAVDATWGTAIKVDGNTYNAGLHNHDGTCENISMDLFVKYDDNNIYLAMVSADADVRGSSESWKGDGVQFKIGTASQKNIYFTVNDDKVGFSGADDYTRNMWVADGNIYATIAIPRSAIDVVGNKVELTFLRISATSDCDYAGWLTYGNFFAEGATSTATATAPCYIVLG